MPNDKPANPIVEYITVSARANTGKFYRCGEIILFENGSGTLRMFDRPDVKYQLFQTGEKDEETKP